VAADILIRPGTRYECHGDGTCCTAIHLLGPLTKTEVKLIKSKARLVFPEGKRQLTTYQEGIKDYVFATHDHKCSFLDDDAQCRFHIEVGPEHKPAVCRHFPLGATKTPTGSRITLSHRCPCVSIGGGAILDEARVRSILASPTTGKIPHNMQVHQNVLWREGKEIRFEEYLRWETALLEQLDGPSPQPELTSVLGMDHPEQLPKLRKKSWNAMSKRMLDWVHDEEEDDDFFCAVRWAALEVRDAKHPWTPPLRPWDWTLRRTAQRVPEPVAPRRIFGAWLADYVWSMTWCADGTAYQAKADMVAKYALAQRIANRLHSTGTREDIAAVEAIMIVDVFCAAEPWEWVRKLLIEAP